jgi:uncharacterized protein
MNGNGFRFPALIRTLHIYLSILGLAAIFFFAVTGFMLNHDDWFGAAVPRVTTIDGTMPADLLQKMDRLLIVEELRRSFGATGPLNTFEDHGPDPLRVVFKHPGYSAEATIDRTTGKTGMEIQTTGVAGLLMDLHRGTFAGKWWGLCIDIAAVLLALASATGLILWLYLPRRRKLGLIALVIGVALCLSAYWAFLPGDNAAALLPDAAPGGRPEARSQSDSGGAAAAPASQPAADGG